MHILSNAIGMLLVRSYERSKRIYDTMVARGYDGKIKTLRTFKMNSKDWLKAFSIIILATLLHVVAFINIFDLVVW